MLQANRLEPFVQGLARFVAGRVPRDDADDVTQDVLLRLHQRTGELRDEERAEAWVFAVARNTIADYYRQRARQPGTDEASDEIPDPSETELPAFATIDADHSIHDEVLSWLRPLVDELPEKYREALILADLERLPQKEVAERLGISVSGAKSRVQRARKMLGENLGNCCRVELGPDGRAIDFERRCDC